LIINVDHRSYVRLIYDRKLRDYYCKILHPCKHSCDGHFYYNGLCSLSL